MQANDVAQWLRDNPEFFDQYADELAEIYVPHSHRGQAISLAERQLLTLREKTGHWNCAWGICCSLVKKTTISLKNCISSASA